MKFFWKIFFSIIVITSITCSIGSYILISSQFEMSLERETDTAYSENDILLYTLGRELEDAVFEVSATDQILATAQNMIISTPNGPIGFTVSSREGEKIYSNHNLEGTKKIYGEIGSDKKGHEICAIDGRYYIHAVSPIFLSGKWMYLENFTDITSLFEAKKEQYATFFYLMAALMIGVGIVTFIVSRVLLKPLGILSGAVKEIAGGDLSRRADIASKDEIGSLAVDFNNMAGTLQSMVTELTDAHRRQEDFIHSFSHELKTPLTSMIGYADMLRTKKMGPERTMNCANYIYTEGRRLEALGQKLIDLIVLDKQDYPLKKMKASDFFEQLRIAFAPIFYDEKIRFSVKAEEAVLEIEPDLMKTVCMNLVDNARKAVEPGGSIALVGQRVKDGYRIAVIDNGRGIPKEELSKITEAFYMVDKSRDRANGGAGLGLHICSRIIALHGGRLEFASKEGKGTIAYIFIKGRTAK